MQPMEPTFLEVLKTNPLPMLVLLVLGFAGFTLGLVALVTALVGRGNRILAAVALVLGGLAGAVGMAGWTMARSTVDAVLVIPDLTAGDRDRLRTMGYAEAGLVAQAGLLAAAPALVLGVLGIVLAGRKKD